MRGGLRGRYAVAALGLTVLLGCAPPVDAGDSARPKPSTDPARSLTASDPMPAQSADSAMRPTASPPASDRRRPSVTSSAGDRTRPPSPPKRFTFTKDHHYYSSPWYDGAWQEMIPFGCTEAPYYPRDYTCPRAKPGRHHGIDTFMTCRTKVRSAVKGHVVRHPRLGAAYGKYGLKIRHRKHDFVLGHLRRLLVKPGEHVKPGQFIARSGKRAAPDGCHLHFEKRPRGGGYTSAVNPLKALRRTIVRFPAS